MKQAVNAHPAGPLHAGVLPPAESAGPHPGSAADARRAGPRGVAARRPPRRRRRGRARRAWTSATSPSGTARRSSSSTRPTSGRARRSSPRAFGARSVHYAAKAFLCTEVARWVADEGLSLDVCSGGELARRAAGGLPGRADRVPRQQQVHRRAGRRGRGGRRRTSWSTRCTRSPGSTRWPASAASTRAGDDPAHGRASRRTPTSSSRPRTRTRSSASRSRAGRRATRPRRSGGCSRPAR